MSRKTYLFSVLAVLAILGAGCGSDSPPPFDEGPVDNGVDHGQPDTGRDVGTDVVEDQGGREDVVTPDVPVDEGSNDTIDAADTTDVAVDADADIPPQPFCPCDAQKNEPVCGKDNKDYTSPECAACAQCASAPDCLGCGGQTTCNTSDDYIARRTKCDECPCNLTDECNNLPYPACGKVCGLVEGALVDFNDLCELKAAVGCIDGYDDFIADFGQCVEQVCGPCEGQPESWVCGSDGKDYKNKCELANCPSSAGVTKACNGKCPCVTECAQCSGTADAPVCGSDGITYRNSCVATTCAGKTVAEEGPCCPDCSTGEDLQVCATDGRVFRNEDCAICKGANPCSNTTNEVCGVDGQTYKNSCVSFCRTGQNPLHSGACVGICEQCQRTLDPVCATNEGGSLQTFQNQCFAECFNATGAGSGLCFTGCQSICGTLANPVDPVSQVCGADGITYPNSCFPQKCFGITFNAGACN